MDFSFNEEQCSLGDTVAQVLSDFPALTGPDLAAAQDAAAWTALSELGLFSLLVPEIQGGVGLQLIDCALAVEALGAWLAPPLVASTLIATEVIARCGSSELKEAVLGKVASGQTSIAVAVAEPGQESPLEPRCTLADGRITGRKIAVAGALDADLFLVVTKGSEGPMLALIESKGPGVQIRAHESLDPSASLGALELNNAAALPGRFAPGMAVERLIDTAAAVEAGLAIGIAGRMQDRAVEYAKTRHQFGQAIGAFQTIKHRCADMAVAVEAGRATAYYAFWAQSSGAPDRSQRASSAKAYCSEIARDACNDSIQIHGGMGFTWELGLHRYLRRAKVLMNSLGGAAWHYGRTFDKSREALSNSSDVRRDAA